MEWRQFHSAEMFPDCDPVPPLHFHSKDKDAGKNEWPSGTQEALERRPLDWSTSSVWLTQSACLVTNEWPHSCRCCTYSWDKSWYTQGHSMPGKRATSSDEFWSAFFPRPCFFPGPSSFQHRLGASCLDPWLSVSQPKICARTWMPKWKSRILTSKWRR